MNILQERKKSMKATIICFIMTMIFLTINVVMIILQSCGVISFWVNSVWSLADTFFMTMFFSYFVFYKGTVNSIDRQLGKK